MRKLAKELAYIRISLADTAGLALARRLVVARANADPGGQAIRAAKSRHVGTYFDQQHGGANQIDTVFAWYAA